MPIDYSLYPSNWLQLREDVLTRALDKCEWCGVENRQRGYREHDGSFVLATAGNPNRHKIIRIVLTIAHLDHNTRNNDLANLAALCQRCHLHHDRWQHAENAAATRRAKKIEQGQMEMKI